MKKLLNIMVAIAIIVGMTSCGGTDNSNNNKPYNNTSSDPALADCQQQNAELAQQLEQYRKNDSVQTAESKIAREVEDSLNKMNLFPLGILPIWNGSKVVHASTYIQSDGSLSSFRWAISDLFEESGYMFLRKVFISAPVVWQKVFLSEQTRIGWLKKKLNVSSVNTDILPYLKDEYSTEGFHKEYVASFKKFYAIHSTSSTDGVWSHPKWDEFETNFFKQFPEAFGGDHSKFWQAYKLWLTAYKIPAPAKKVMAQIITNYNGL